MVIMFLYNYNSKGAWSSGFSSGVSSHPMKAVVVFKGAPKVKYFFWRCYWNILSSKSALQHRGVPIRSLCEVCSEPKVSLFHVFFSCHMSRLTWELTCPWVTVIINNWPGDGDL
ncbi:hypothetical protein COLO4_38089 [Corchorus olitorius]|uniref:Reverse transcriptase zinc-binding domain-containing protein n=1 Tax=Corchorus olitorius TaxID=93759 RepID=A0A1R3FXD8_9ROSI|nr:hypothetical protein COLO4_38089 [Corchorus olitorius]